MGYNGRPVFTVEGFPEEALNGAYKFVEGFFLNDAMTMLIYYYNVKKWQFKKNAGLELAYESLETQDSDCTGIVDSGLEFVNINGTDSFTPSIKCFNEETPAPTTTHSCPICRRIVNQGPVSSMYNFVGSGDERCSMDGCLYQKMYTN